MTPVIDVPVHLYPERRVGGVTRRVHRAMPGHPVPADITRIAQVRESGLPEETVRRVLSGNARELFDGLRLI